MSARLDALSARAREVDARRAGVAFVAALVLALAGCTAARSPHGYGSSVPLDPRASAPGHAKQTPPSARTHDPRPGSTVTAPPRGGDPGVQPSFRDGGGVGEMARAYLRDRPARRLIVQVDFIHGRRPGAGALNHLQSVLARECAKAGGVQVAVGNDIPETRQTYSFADIASLEHRYRNAHSGGDTAAMWIVYLNGDLAGEQGTLGVSFNASSAAIFADRVADAATPIIGEAGIERATLTHEAGHLLALVNLGYTSPHDHEDPNHPKHSRSKRSVMYWAVEDVSVAALLTGGPPDDFDADDRDDLRRLRDGTL